MTYLIYAACAWVLLPWVDNAVYYDFYEDAEYVATLEPGSPENPEGYKIEVCRLEYYTDVVYQYIAGNDVGESDMSDTLTVQWVTDFDRDENGIVGFSDFGAFARVFGSDHPTDLWADANGIGLVDFGDFGFFVAQWAHCNNGTFEVGCG